MNAVAIIPARYASGRLPGKPLRKLCGKPLVQWVWEAASKARNLSRVIIAADSERIAAVCRRFGADTVIIPDDVPSGTDRVARAYERLRLQAAFVLNVQADEPLLQPQHIEMLITSLAEHAHWDAATLVQPIKTTEELLSPAVVKVVLRADRSALYFSRAPIPYVRAHSLEELLHTAHFWKHVGIYAYRAPILQRFCMLPASPLERAEGLEQLRLLEAGYTIGCLPAEGFLMGVDTAEQLAQLRRWFRSTLRCRQARQTP